METSLKLPESDLTRTPTHTRIQFIKEGPYFKTYPVFVCVCVLHIMSVLKNKAIMTQEEALMGKQIGHRGGGTERQDTLRAALIKSF